MTAARKYPIESFGPEIMGALQKGAREEFSIALPSYRDAVRFQQRIHMLRKAMREANHPLYPVAARVHISLSWGKLGGFPIEVETTTIGKGNRVPVDRGTPTRVTLKPRDSEFQAALLQGGVTKEELKDDPLQDMPETPTSAPAPGTIDALFAPEPKKEVS